MEPDIVSVFCFALGGLLPSIPGIMFNKFVRPGNKTEISPEKEVNGMDLSGTVTQTR